MKKSVASIIVIAIMVMLGGCASERSYEYPSVYRDMEPKESQKIEIQKPKYETVVIEEKTYFDIPKDGEIAVPVQPVQPDLPPIKEEPVDVFDLLNEVDAPMGCTAGVDC